jgi:hypothetical protein
VAHITAQITEELFARLLTRALSTKPAVSFSAPAAGGLVWFGATGQFHIAGCDGVEFEDGDTFLLSELDLAWDQLEIELGLDIPSFEVGGFCVLPIPEFLGGGCVRMKRYTVFPGSPDIGPVGIDLTPLVSLIVTEVSGRCRIRVRKVPGKQEVHAQAEALDVDLIDLQGTVAQWDGIVQAAVAVAAAQLVQAMPAGGWLMDYVLGKLGLPTPTSVVLDLLDIGDDAQEWLMDVLNTSIGLPDLIATWLFNEIDAAIVSLDNPFPIKADETLTAADYGGFAAPPPATVPIDEIGIPIEHVDATFSNDLLTVAIDLDVPQ